MKQHATDDLILQIRMTNGEVHAVPIDYHILGGIAVVSHLGEAPIMGIDKCTHCAVIKFIQEYVQYHYA